MVKNVFRRLGFRFNLNNTIIEAMYDLCRYEKAWNVNHHSPWCTAFTKDQLKMLEYAEDLQTFYKYGYGNPENKNKGCGPLRDLINRFEKSVDGYSNEQKVSIQFTDEEGLLAMIVAMGMYKDYNPLSADNYFTQSRRQWMTSNLSPFAGNLAAVLYQ